MATVAPPFAGRFGPWADGIDRAQRVARLRSLRAIACLTLETRGLALAHELRRAEQNNQALDYALAALAPPDRRSVLASFGRLHRPVSKRN